MFNTAEHIKNLILTAREAKGDIAVRCKHSKPGAWQLEGGERPEGKTALW